MGSQSASTWLPAVTDPSEQSGIWRWVERASWLVGIIGLPVASYFALRQLSHIERELARRPDVRLGFDEPYAGSPGSGVRATGRARRYPRQADPPRMQAELAVTVVNRGTRTARKLQFNFVLPPSLLIVDSPEMRLERDLDNDAYRRIAPKISLNPGVHYRWRIQLTLPPGIDSFPMRASVAMEDAESRDEHLTVLV